MPVPRWKRKKLKELETHAAGILELLAYDLKDPNFRDTPRRMARTWFEELYVHNEPAKNLFTVFPDTYDQMIVLQGHETWSMCPHHLERVKFTITLGYVPNGLMIGFSKLGRIPDYFAKGLVLQEAFTDQIADGFFKALKPKGVGVYVEGQHLCMQARGLKTRGSVITTALKGIFMDDEKTRIEFMDYCRGRR